MATSVINTLLNNVRDRLITEMITAISDETKAGLVQVGVLREDPTETVINVLVKSGGPEWRHTENRSSENVGMQAPLGEIGGGIYWRRRFVAEFKIFFAEAFDQSEARTTANICLSRAEWALQNKDLDGNWWFDTSPDSFEEVPSRIQVYDSYLIEGGGEDSWIWKGEIRLEFLTEKVGCV